jgi:predicted ATPase
MYDNIECPKELIEFSDSPEDVNVLVGQNGSGKSMLLNELARYHVSEGRNVIALANSIYDKFNVRRRNFKILRHSHGKGIAKRSMIELLKLFSDIDSVNKFSVLRTFEYIGFDKVLGVNIKNKEVDQFDNGFEPDKYQMIRSFLDYYKDTYDYYSIPKEDGFLLINLDENDHKRQLSSTFFERFRELKLHQKTILRNFDFALLKDGELIKLLSASSGELSLFTSLIFISANIDKETVILIDEPENSLHPKWQIEYIKQLLDLFHLYRPKIVIATHSPLIINGGKLNVENINIFKGSPNGFFLLNRNQKNVEEIYEEYFDVTTPENRYLSDFVMSKFNLLTEKKLDVVDFENLINRLIDQSYDEIQKNALKGIVELALRVNSNR